MDDIDGTYRKPKLELDHPPSTKAHRMLKWCTERKKVTSGEIIAKFGNNGYVGRFVRSLEGNGFKKRTCECSRTNFYELL